MIISRHIFQNINTHAKNNNKEKQLRGILKSRSFATGTHDAVVSSACLLLFFLLVQSTFSDYELSDRTNAASVSIFPE